MRRPELFESIDAETAVLNLDEHDRALVELARAVLDQAVLQAHSPSGVSKRLTSLAVRHRNKGRAAARRRYPFNGVCEASGQPLDAAHAHLDEPDPELGYAGRLRWVCPRANNSGNHSCGVCK